MKKNIENIEIEGAKIEFRNFEGREKTFNTKGKRNFCIFLEPDLAKKLERKGWNIKWLKPRDEQEDQQAMLKVTVSYKNFPPEVLLYTRGGKTKLDEESIAQLDTADILSCDVVLNPYKWEMNGRTGVTAYLVSMKVMLKEDKFAKKWSNSPDEVGDDDLPF